MYSVQSCRDDTRACIPRDKLRRRRRRRGKREEKQQRKGTTQGAQASRLETLGFSCSGALMGHMAFMVDEFQNFRYRLFPMGPGGQSGIGGEVVRRRRRAERKEFRYPPFCISSLVAHRIISHVLEIFPHA